MTIVKPDVPQTVIRFSGTPVTRIAPTAAETVAVPVVHDWGPIGTDPPGADKKQGGAQLLGSFSEWTDTFGDSDTPGRTAVAGAFAGQNLPGLGGAGGVLVFRMAGSAAAAAAIVIHNTASGTPAALTLTGKYKGTRANSFTYTIDADPSNVARDRLRIYYQGILQETYLYANTNIVALAAAINARSKLVTATETATGVRLALTSGGPVALTGGNDGSTLTTQNHVDALNAIQFKPFSALAPMDSPDSTTQAAYVSWTQSQVLANRPARLVLGGDSADTVDDGLTDAAGWDDEHVVRFAGGVWHDDLLDKDLSTSQLASRLAGIIVAKGRVHSATSAKIGGLHPVGITAPTPDDIVAAVTGGVVALTLTSADDADVRIAKAVTTFTSSADPQRPLDVFSDVRLIGLMDDYVRRMKQWGDDIVIGTLPVNDDTRGLVFGHAKMIQDEYLRDGLILPGDGDQIPTPWVEVVNTDADPSLSDAIPYNFGWQFARTTNAILGEGRVR